MFKESFRNRIITYSACISLLAALFMIFSSAPVSAKQRHANRTNRIKSHANGTILYKILDGKANGITIYTVTYYSDGLKVKGKLFVPAAAEKKKKKMKLPAVVFNHGGVDGIPKPLIMRSRELSAKGYVVFAPSYRGEDNSGGRVEVAAGEVNDVLAAVTLLRRLPYVNPKRIGMIGASHGGIITLLAIERDHSLQAAVSAYGVTNTYSWYQYLVDNGFDVTDPLSTQTYGKGPKDKPEAFNKRSPALHANLIKTPLLLLYGADDKTVPPTQAEELAAALDAAGKSKFYSLHILPDVGHGLLFFTDPKRRSATEIRQSSTAWKLLTDFLAAHLKQKGK